MMTPLPHDCSHDSSGRAEGHRDPRQGVQFGIRTKILKADGLRVDAFIIPSPQVYLTLGIGLLRQPIM